VSRRSRSAVMQRITLLVASCATHRSQSVPRRMPKRRQHAAKQLHRCARRAGALRRARRAACCASRLRTRDPARTGAGASVSAALHAGRVHYLLPSAVCASNGSLCARFAAARRHTHRCRRAGRQEKQRVPRAATRLRRGLQSAGAHRTSCKGRNYAWPRPRAVRTPRCAYRP
jgi:hypothetical protein